MNTPISNMNFGQERCATAEAEVLHGAAEDRREAELEARRAEAELMPNVFRLKAEQSLIQDEDLLRDLLSEQSFATSRLALYTACPDLLPADYAESQKILDENIVRTTVRDWVKIAADEIQEKWIEEGE